MTAFYNEIDPYAAQWLRNLIAAGHIAPGVVDERPIQDIEPYELVGFTQCHFFAGIGVWSHALRRAGWADDRPIWTGSCPCQPFSAAGKQKGFKDDRHLWPHWQKLIDECKPSVVIGEQVASALDWVDLVQADLEKSGYAFGANDLCAAGFGGAHIRQRIYFVGLEYGAGNRRQQWRAESSERCAISRCSDSGLADAESARRSNGPTLGGSSGQILEPGKPFIGIGDQLSVSGMADDNQQQRSGSPVGSDDPRGRDEKPTAITGFHRDSRTDAPLLGREAVDWLYCRDGKWRPVGPGTFPLVDETPARVGRLRAYGNALDAETAAQFCGAVREICDEAGI